MVDWGKIKHVETGHELIPSQVEDYLRKIAEKPVTTKKKEPVTATDLAEMSTFLSINYKNNDYLYCHLTRR